MRRLTGSQWEGLSDQLVLSALSVAGDSAMCWSFFIHLSWVGDEHSRLSDISGIISKSRSSN